jgi:hypothetical protein
VSDAALFVRCPYCRTDSLVALDALQAAALNANIERAEASAQAAIERARARRAKTWLSAKWMAAIWLAMIAFLLFWVFLPSTDVGLALVAGDMLILSMLTYMMAIGTLIGTLDRWGFRASRFAGALGLIAFVVAIASTVTLWIVAS